MYVKVNNTSGMGPTIFFFYVLGSWDQQLQLHLEKLIKSATPLSRFDSLIHELSPPPLHFETTDTDFTLPLCILASFTNIQTNTLLPFFSNFRIFVSHVIINCPSFLPGSKVISKNSVNLVRWVPASPFPPLP